MDDLDSEWRRKGATLSHKTAQEEFGLTWEKIVQAIRAGKLHYQEQSMHGNPWLRNSRRSRSAFAIWRNSTVRTGGTVKPSRFTGVRWPSWRRSSLLRALRSRAA